MTGRRVVVAAVVAWVLSFLVSWAVGGFVVLDGNLLHWSPEGRSGLIVAATTIGIAAWGAWLIATLNRLDRIEQAERRAAIVAERERFALPQARKRGGTE